MVQFHSQNICRLCFLRYHLKLWCECNLRNLINWFGMLIAKICAKLSTHQLPPSDPLKACIDLRMFNFGKNVLHYWSLATKGAKIGSVEKKPQFGWPFSKKSLAVSTSVAMSTAGKVNMNTKNLKVRKTCCHFGPLKAASLSFFFFL